jgi:hypothetical protein
MKYHVLALVSCLALANCTRPPSAPPPQSEPIGLDTLPADTSTDREFVRINSANPAENGPAQAPVKLHLFPSDAGSTPQEVVRRRLFGLLPAKKATPPPNPLSKAEEVPRKCKGCTFNMVAGNQTNQQVGKKGQLLGNGATNVENPKAPTNTAPGGSATDNTKQGQRGGAAASAPGATATATTEKAGFPYWVLAIPVVVYVGYRKFIAI